MCALISGGNLRDCNTGNDHDIEGVELLLRTLRDVRKLDDVSTFLQHDECGRGLREAVSADCDDHGKVGMG